MTNRTKIIIAILIILAIIVTIFGIINVNSTKNKKNKEQDEIDNMMEYLDQTDKNHENDNKIDEVEEQNNFEVDNIISDTNKISNQIQRNNSSVGNKDVVGKEEKESTTENTELNNENTAIELAKKEWGISIDSYIFEAELKGEYEYEVTVRNKLDRNVVTIYNVNVKTGAVKE